MIPILRKFILSDSKKNDAALNIFFVLNAYAVITTIYTKLFYDWRTTAIRFLLSLLIVIIYGGIERSRLSRRATAFLSPTLISFALIFGAWYFKGDGLLFTYMSCVAFISLSYYDSRSVALHITVVGLTVGVLLFVFGVNLLGLGFSMVYNIISFIASLGMNVLIYFFCVFYVNALNALTAAKDEANLSAERLKEASSAKSSFLANMSHEIRTPMNAIIGMTQIADKSLDIKKIKYCLTQIENSSTHLLGLINDILDMSKIEAGKLELDSAPLNIEHMLIKVSNFISELVEQKHIAFDARLDTDMSMCYLGDELRISQVVTNLVSNAVKFTPANGNIRISVSESRREDTRSVLRFSIKDTGIGMTGEQMSKLFNAFQQAESSTARKFGGTGLGLTISQGIVKKMEGDIWVESELGKGSEFIFEIRLIRPEKQDKLEWMGHIPPGDIKLMIVTPKGEMWEYYKEIVKGFGINAVMAEDLAGAVALAEKARESQKPYDVVFLDHTLVENIGARFRESNSFKINKNNVIIMSTFLGWNRHENELRQAGINRFISKPLFPSTILNSIGEVVYEESQNEETPVQAPAAHPDFSGFTLLLAEDIDINREIFITMMEDTKVTIDIAENGLIALEKYKENPSRYAAVIMDVQMPEMDGYEATRRIRGLEAGEAEKVPIIAMTANVFKDDIEKCFAAGMDSHIGKPVDFDEVIGILKKFLK